MRLSQYLSAELVTTDLVGATAEEVIDRIASCFADAGVVEDGGEVREALVARERSHTTSMGYGVAIPHATIPELSDTWLMIGVAPEPIPFGPPDADPVNVFFVLLSPPGRESEHIKLLARVCRLSRHPGFLDDLAAASGPAEALEVVRMVDAEHV